MDDLAGKVGVFLAGKLVYPALLWTGAKVAGWGGFNALSQGQRVALLLGGMGAATYVLYRPERSLDLLLSGVATVANTTGQALGVVANQVRTLEKVDMEKILNDQVEFLGPLFAPEAEEPEQIQPPPPPPPSPSPSPSLTYFGPEEEPRPIFGPEQRPAIPITQNTTNTTNTTQINEPPVLPPPRIAPPPPLRPKDYTIENFPWYIKSPTQLRFIKDPEVDSFIQAYNLLGIDVVSMILKDRQLPQMKLVKEIYIQRIRHFHPDKNMVGQETATQLSSYINISYTKIKKMMRSADEQADIITPILQFFHKGHYSPTPYIILFFGGLAFAVWLAK